MVRRIREGLERLVRRAWMKHALRGVGQNDAHEQLERAYRIRDPWKLDSEPERFRYRETNRFLAQAFPGGIEALLEIGCGEGYQSEVLARTCRQLTGIDVSPTAVGRARERLPLLEFCVGDLYSHPWSGERDRFDVVVACEVLYYLSDLPKALEAMERLCRRGCLVTYFSPAERKLGAALASRPGVKRDAFRFGDTEWTIAWWPKARQSPID
jgi:SAM-dependent methyltransferase